MITLEIERKFLVSEDLNPTQLDNIHNVIDVMQGYTEDGIRFTERYDHYEDELTYLINIKHGTGMVRREGQCKITEEVFALAWPKTIGRRIIKTRYIIPFQNYMLELDEYTHARHYPFSTVEIEFENEKAAQSLDLISLPEWVKQEVTGKPGFSNKDLAC